MATISEKLDHFRKMFGGEAAQILDTASQVEKEADELKVEYKETDTETPAPVTEKAPAEKVGGLLFQKWCAGQEISLLTRFTRSVFKTLGF